VRYGYYIKFINNPSEKVQLAAVRNNEDALRFINKPSEQVQLVAVSQNKTAIDYISNPPEKVRQLYKQLYGKNY
jgi:hypothetical protein